MVGKTSTLPGLKPLKLTTVLRLTGFIFLFGMSLVLTTNIASQAPKFLVVAARMAIALGFILAFSFISQKNKAAPKPSSHLVLALAGGSLAAAQILEVYPRYSDVPSGSNVTFILSLVPVFVLLIALFLRRARLSGAIAVSLGTLAMISILANWERPSSFAPFVRWTDLDLYLLFSAASWAVLLLLLQRAVRDLSAPSITTYVLGYGTVFSLIAAFLAGEMTEGALSQLGAWLPYLVLLGVLGTGLAMLLVIEVLKEVEVERASLAFFATPLMVMVLYAAEPAVGFLGVSPVVWAPLTGGVLLTLVSLVTGFFGQGSSSGRYGEMDWFSRGLSFLSIVLTLIALIGLFRPIEFNFIAGTLDSGAKYDAEWFVYGYAAVGGYVLLIGSLVALLAAVRQENRVFWSTINLFLLSAFIVSGRTIIMNWHTWMPVEIQQALGTPYVALDSVSLTNAAWVVAFVCLLLVSLVSLVTGLTRIPMVQSELLLGTPGRRPSPVDQQDSDSMI